MQKYFLSDPFHKQSTPQSVKVVKVFVKENVKDVKVNSCIYCNKEFSSRQYKWEHQKKYCKNKNEEIDWAIEKQRFSINSQLTFTRILLCNILVKIISNIKSDIANTTNTIMNNNNNNK